MRNATCADTQISIEWPYSSFLYCTLTDFTMGSFYRKEVFMFVDTMSWVLSLKISSLEDSFLPLIDILDANKTPSLDKGEKLATLFPDDISDALFSEIFFSHCDKLLTLRDTADFAIEYYESSRCIKCHKCYKADGRFSNIFSIKQVKVGQFSCNYLVILTRHPPNCD